MPTKSGKPRPKKEELPTTGEYNVVAREYPADAFLPLHENIASGQYSNTSFRVCRSATSLHMFLIQDVVPDGESRREMIDLAELIEVWVKSETRAAHAREVAQVLLDTFDRMDDDEEKWMWEGAQRMACILLGDNWDGKLD